MELGAKYRFVEETDERPQIGVFPLVELPSGDADRGLGAGHVRAFLPIWIQKRFGAWTTYGGGYWINPGAGNCDYWFAGGQVQVHATSSLSPGIEIYYQSPSTQGRNSEVHYNAGLILDLGEKSHVLLSAGRAVRGCDCAHAYLSYLLTLGPTPYYAMYMLGLLPEPENRVNVNVVATASTGATGVVEIVDADGSTPSGSGPKSLPFTLAGYSSHQFNDALLNVHSKFPTGDAGLQIRVRMNQGGAGMVMTYAIVNDNTTNDGYVVMGSMMNGGRGMGGGMGTGMGGGMGGQ
ncbi:MAG: hypothetical protein KBB14_16785 [Thermoanaerobaculia bacterium]|nr:hypothetical protein [Thermoanaerobaculia bacterium]